MMNLTNPLPNANNVKQGEKLNVKVSVNRLYDFKDLIQVDAKPSSGLKGVTVKKVNIDQYRIELFFVKVSQKT